MKAKVVKAFMGRSDNEVVTREIGVDEIIAGELAAVAVREGWAEVVDEADSETGETKPVEDMTVDELKAYAKAKDIDLGNAKKKDEILAAIRTAETGETKPVEDMTVDELKALAAEKSIDLGDATDAEAIRAKVSAALADQA